MRATSGGFQTRSPIQSPKRVAEGRCPSRNEGINAAVALRFHAKAEAGPPGFFVDHLQPMLRRFEEMVERSI